MSYSPVVYERDGVETDYDVPFLYNTAAHVKAAVAGELQTFTWLTGSRIQMEDVGTAGDLLVVYRATDTDAPAVTFQAASTPIANPLNQAVLQLLYALQEQSEATARSLRAPHGEEVAELPDAETRANQHLGFDADGNPIASGGPSDVTISAALTPVVQAATFLAALQAGGMTAQTAAALLQNTAASVLEGLGVDDYGDGRWAQLSAANAYEGVQTAPGFTSTEANANATLRTLRTGTTTVDARMRSAATKAQVGSFSAHGLELLINSNAVAELNTSGELDFTLGAGTAKGLRAPAAAGEAARYQDVSWTEHYGSSENTVAAATTTYMGQGNVNGTPDVVGFRATRACKMHKLYASADGSPGGSDTFAYTVFKNGVATALTCTSSGARTSEDTNTGHVVSVAAGDRIEVRLVTSATANVRKHRCSIEFGI